MFILDVETRIIVEANRSAAEFYGWPLDELIGKSIAEINTLGKAAANAIVITDRDGIVRWANAAFERLAGVPRGEAIGRSADLLVADADIETGIVDAMKKTLVEGKVWHGELKNRRKDGSDYVEEITVTPVPDEARRTTGFVAIINDVTERELSRERIMASLREREELLREIPSRIDANLQLLIGLLELSIQGAEDPRLLVALDEISRRFQSMALIYDEFLASEDRSRVDFMVLLRKAAENLRSDFPAFRGSVVVEGEGPVPLAHEKALPAGLVASEFIEGDLKRACLEGAGQGEVRIRIETRDGLVILSVFGARAPDTEVRLRFPPS